MGGLRNAPFVDVDTAAAIGLGNVDNTSDADKPVSTAGASANALKANASAVSNVDNTSDADKPVSTAQQTALNLKANASAVSNITNTSDANKPVSTAQQTALNLKANASAVSNVTNTSDADKPVSTAQQTALDLKAVLPTFSKAANGYYKDNDSGIIYQWGITGSIAGNGNTTVTFPIAFPTALTYVGATRNDDSYTSGDEGSINAVLSSLTQSKLVNSASSTASTVTWLAVGY